ncbi:hypothetical protein OEZ85_002589 [Tetradesmus obliquus]|uniref:CUB domain-containing protein n=1 Tax=Tetradesmus obliquus TaxID=3088 RepID=A0ABY8TYI8_TETOB|nr:hypothetical protein OEZ85_002589 [Tetradesmus obliquus]
MMPVLLLIVLITGLANAFNPEDNSLLLSFSGAWSHTASSSFSAAFKLELLDTSGTELLTFESPTLHHRTLSSPQQQQQQQQQQRKPILLNYTTVFNDVQLVPGEQATLWLTTQDSSFQGFQASIRLMWQQQQQVALDLLPVFESATPGGYGQSLTLGEYGADSAAAAAAAAAAAGSIFPEAPAILSREQLPYYPPAPLPSSSGSSSSDDTLAPAPIMDPTDPAAPLDIREGVLTF